MGANCCSTACETTRLTKRYRKILWVALVVNLGMFGVEVIAGVRADSVSLLADSLDFLGDAANYGISLLVLGMSLTLRAKASLFKALSMLAFGVGVLIAAIWHLLSGQVPDAPTKGWVGSLALLANVGVAFSLYGQRAIWWLAGAAGALMGVVWNYAVSSLFVWRAR